ncbi:MAG: NPCBM/NEW2 domain-containing protein [Verrucomicrobiia bacterium]
MNALYLLLKPVFAIGCHGATKPENGRLDVGSLRGNAAGRIATLICGLAVLIGAAGLAAQPARFEYLSDRTDLILSSSQNWGMLGLDTAAHAAGVQPMPLRVGEKDYAKGLGHHANGEILVVLDGNFTRFDAEVGIQTQADDQGTVVFRVMVDGKEAFKSGVVRQRDGALPIHVDLAGAQEMTLDARDAGDGIACDMAVWGNARLVPAATSSAPRAQERVDMARFARVVTWDPARKTGARASRVEEFLAEDLFLETDLVPDAEGLFRAPSYANGQHCIGLQWLNRRAIRELAVQWADPSLMPPAGKVEVEFWSGESAWQGQWKPLAGELSVAGDRLVMTPNPRGEGGLLQVQKIRWIFPEQDRPVPIRELTALTRTRWDTASFFLEVENPPTAARGKVRVYNGELLTPAELEWDLARPLRLSIRYCRRSISNSDATSLQFQLPGGSFAVGLSDVMERGCVYVPAAGLFVAREPMAQTLADYKKSIADRNSILEEVREMPDQTRAQAMARTHHPVQDHGPVMLSLACDNVKFVVSREGAVEFETSAKATGGFFVEAAVLRPRFGKGAHANLKRWLDGGWLPIPVTSVEEGGILYSQRTFVAPCEASGEPAKPLNQPSVCVVEFTARNTRSEPAAAEFALSFLDSAAKKAAGQFVDTARGFLGMKGGKALALLDTNARGPLVARHSDGTVTFEGTLPAGSSARVVLYLPGVGKTAETLGALPDTEKLRDAVEAYWRDALAPAMQVDVPDELVNRVIRSSQVRCLIDARNEADGARIAPWIAAMSYGPLESEGHSVIRGMDFMGHADFARRALDFFVHRYNKAGFLTTGYTVFGTGWHLWTLGEHYQLNHDTKWLRQVAPEVIRVGDWITRQLEKTKQLDARGQRRPEYGLMPPGVLADWNSFAYHYCMSAYYYAGLRKVGAALESIQNPKGAEFLRTAAELRTSLLRAYTWTRSQTPVLPLRDGTWVAAYPSQVHSPGKLGDFFPGQDAGRSWCYDVELGAHQLVPTEVLGATGPEVTEMMHHMEDVQFLADGWFDYSAEMNHADWFNLGGFSKVQPYYTRNAEIYALRDEVKPFVRSYFNAMASLLNTENLTLWEHFHNGGAYDKTHETGYFLHQTRSMLLMERGEELWLNPLTTSNWLQDGMTLSVQNAPTRFGTTAYVIRSQLGRRVIEAAITPPDRVPPKRLVLRLRHPDGQPIRAVTLNDQSHGDFNAAAGLIHLRPAAGPLRVRVQY